jgi:hypothetical protein
MQVVRRGAPVKSVGPERDVESPSNRESSPRNTPARRHVTLENSRESAMTDDTSRKPSKVEGEGSYSATRAYDAGVEKTVKSGKVEQKAQEAKRATEGREGAELRKAEAIGKRHSHGEDPALNQKK